MTRENFKGEILEEVMPIKLDLIDRKILYFLSLNTRFSNKAIAQALKTSREVVAYRIKKMEDENFLTGYLTVLSHRKLGFKNYMVYVKLKSTDKEEELINHLFAFEEVTRLKNCSGAYDLQIVITVKNEEEFASLLDKIMSNYHNIINSYDVLEILDEGYLGLNFIVEGNVNGLNIHDQKGTTFEKEFKISSKIEDIKLDNKDIELLDIIKLNSRITIKELSNKVNLTNLAVKNRIKKLIQSEVIKGFIFLASVNRLNYQWWKVFFKFKNLNKNKFISYMKYHPNIPWYMRLLGRWDYQCSIFAKNNAEFHKILNELRKEFAENIINYDSVIVFNQFKYIQKVK